MVATRNDKTVGAAKCARLDVKKLIMLVSIIFFAANSHRCEYNLDVMVLMHKDEKMKATTILLLSLGLGDTRNLPI